jgi:CRP-like cAMP-binding protein
MNSISNDQHPCETCPVFKDSLIGRLPADEARNLKEHALMLKYGKGQRIMSAHDAAQGMFCIRSGLIKIFREVEGVGTVALGFRKPGNLLGHYGLMRNKNTCSADCMTSMEACFFPRRVVLKESESSLLLLRGINGILYDDMAEMVEQLTNCFAGSTDHRLVRTIMRLEDTCGKDTDGYIAMPLTRRTLAELIGASIESVFRSLTFLKGKGWVEVKKEKIRIIQREQLDLLLRGE